jgi:adenylate cyclase
MIEGLKEKEKVRAVLNKVVSPEIATEILQNPLQLGGEEKKLTVLFADIRGFTHLTEHMPPQEVIGLLNECMTKISTLVDAHKGIIDKYVGDEAMALFGFPKEEPQSVTDAVACALNIVESMVLWNQERERQNLPKIEVGIGVHTGMVVAGNMGSENRLNYTVLGRNVNLTARLCSLAKSDEVLITEDVLKSPGIVDLFFVEKMPDADLKGFSHSFPIYKVLGKKLPKN